MPFLTEGGVEGGVPTEFDGRIGVEFPVVAGDLERGGEPEAVISSEWASSDEVEILSEPVLR